MKDRTRPWIFFVAASLLVLLVAVWLFDGEHAAEVREFLRNLLRAL